MTATLSAARGALTARPAPAGAGPRASATAVARLLLPPVSEPVRGRLEQAVTPRAPSRSVLSPVTSAAWPVAAGPEPRPEPRLGDPTPLAGAVVVAAIEALRCVRPLAQLARWVSPEVYEALACAVEPAPAPTARRAMVRSVRVCRLGGAVAEGSVVVHDGARVRAAAVRLEAHRGSWRATVLQIG